MSKKEVTPLYDATHKWVRYWFGKADHCEKCLDNPKSLRFEWSNISGNYIRERSDWQQLCKACHAVFDMNVLESTHGSASHYINAKCRCELCRKAHNSYIKLYRQKMGITPQYYRNFKLMNGKLIRKVNTNAL